jgi:hypothetical protein
MLERYLLIYLLSLISHIYKKKNQVNVFIVKSEDEK